MLLAHQEETFCTYHDDHERNDEKGAKERAGVKMEDSGEDSGYASDTTVTPSTGSQPHTPTSGISDAALISPMSFFAQNRSRFQSNVQWLATVAIFIWVLGIGVLSLAMLDTEEAKIALWGVWKGLFHVPWFVSELLEACLEGVGFLIGRAAARLAKGFMQGFRN